MGQGEKRAWFFYPISKLSAMQYFYKQKVIDPVIMIRYENYDDESSSGMIRMHLLLFFETCPKNSLIQFWLSAIFIFYSAAAVGLLYL